MLSKTASSFITHTFQHRAQKKNNSYTLTYKENKINYTFKNDAFSDWTLGLSEDSIQIGKKTFDIQSIEYVVFDVERTYYYGNYSISLCASGVYLKLKKDEKPIQLLSLVIEEEFIYGNKSECYEVTLNLIKHIGKKYDLPFSYSMSIETKEKESRLIFITVLPIIMILVYILTRG